jgi:hypothetical protein
MLKNLKSLFIIEEEGKASAAKAPAGKGEKSTPANAPAAKPASDTPAAAARPGRITSKFTDILLGAMDKANLDGFDYLEYKKSLQSLQKMNMDEATAYQSAFAMASTMGATPAKLVETAGHYLEILQAEEKKFQAALAKQQEGKVGAQRQEQQELRKLIQDKEARIKQLEAEIKRHQEKLGKLDQTIASAATKIENTKNDFIASYDNLVRQIDADREKMKKYLK